MYNQFILQSPGKARVKIDRALLTTCAAKDSEFQNSLFHKTKKCFEWQSVNCRGTTLKQRIQTVVSLLSRHNISVLSYLFQIKFESVFKSMFERTKIQVMLTENLYRLRLSLFQKNIWTRLFNGQYSAHNILVIHLSCKINSKL